MQQLISRAGQTMATSMFKSVGVRRVTHYLLLRNVVGGGGGCCKWIILSSLTLMFTLVAVTLTFSLLNDVPVVEWTVKGDSAAGPAITSTIKRQRNDIDIDDERRALRLLERFNLMEETYGANWSTTAATLTLLQQQQCTIEYANTQRLQQDHPCVIELIRRHYLKEPAPKHVAYNLKFPNHTNPSFAQSEAILRLLQNKTNGFFVECGGYNGEAMSNTLYMERFLNWTGVLIEPDTITFPLLMTKKRKSWALPVCLSLEPHPVKVTFNNTIPGIGTAIIDGDNKKLTQSNPIRSASYSPKAFDVQCFPLYSILLALNRTSDIDYISLDVEGHEFRILKTVPWHKIDVKTLSVEWDHLGEGEEAMSRYMILHGFVRFGRISESFTKDVVYVKDYLEDFRNFDDY